MAYGPKRTLAFSKTIKAIASAASVSSRMNRRSLSLSFVFISLKGMIVHTCPSPLGR